jgi:hypothetical protein
MSVNNSDGILLLVKWGHPANQDNTVACCFSVLCSYICHSDHGLYISIRPRLSALCALTQPDLRCLEHGNAVNTAAYCGLGTGSVCYISQFRPNLNRKYTELKNITLLAPIIARRNRLGYNKRYKSALLYKRSVRRALGFYDNKSSLRTAHTTVSLFETPRNPFISFIMTVSQAVTATISTKTGPEAADCHGGEIDSPVTHSFQVTSQGV